MSRGRAAHRRFRRSRCCWDLGLGSGVGSLGYMVALSESEGEYRISLSVAYVRRVFVRYEVGGVRAPRLETVLHWGR